MRSSICILFALISSLQLAAPTFAHGYHHGEDTGIIITSIPTEVMVIPVKVSTQDQVSGMAVTDSVPESPARRSLGDDISSTPLYARSNEMPRYDQVNLGHLVRGPVRRAIFDRDAP
ncbi:hypothetical protein F5148DRAFT_1154878 [Russula earlei]|uniref:Uncharacterized protein n=1 Tax=Russula earlei TaxID=71964 RepID=A0ACC0TRG4_9AGAM|nr:hypothetical protein F5148DRAFT_1154878 [Russula earlei]